MLSRYLNIAIVNQAITRILGTIQRYNENYEI